MSRRINEEILERTVSDMVMDFKEKKAQQESQCFALILRNVDQLRHSLQSSSKLPQLEPHHDVYDTKLNKEYEEWCQILQPYVVVVVADGDGAVDDNNNNATKQLHHTWLTAPWLITEFYVYRQLMQCLDYWNPVSPGYLYDPFQRAKRAGLHNSPASAETCLLQLARLPRDTPEGLALAVGLALWGNQMDLSLWPATTTNTDDDNSDRFGKVLEAAADQLLADDTKLLTNYCFETLRDKMLGGNVDIIVDNAGFELVTDLALAQFLIESGIAKQVTFQLKAHPTFVSDALTKDLLDIVSYYETAVNVQQYPACVAAAAQWRQYLQAGIWKCHEDFFWVQPLAMAWEMTEPLRSNLQRYCDLAFVKGDANYRRLLGDRDWDWATPFSDIVQEFPVPICALRTLKAELGCGMSKEQTDRAKAADPNWMTNGKFGVVQFANNNHDNNNNNKRC